MASDFLLACIVLACGGLSPSAAQSPNERAQHVVVGSKAFTESHLLGEIMKLLLEEHTDLAVEHRSGLGGTLICHEALLQDEIQIYPEYTGTAWTAILGRSDTQRDGLRTFLTVESEYLRRFDVQWLQPFGMNNTYVLAMREERAAALGIRTLSDLARAAGELRGGFSIEFLERPDGLPGLASTYGLHLGEARGMEHALAYQGLLGGALDVIDAYATDGKLARHALRQLVDDRGFFPPYHGAPVVRRDLLERHPEVARTLDMLAFRLSDDSLRRLNYLVEEEGKRFEDVARSWLADSGLLEEVASLEENHGSLTLLGWFLARWREILGHMLRHLQLTLIAVVSAAGCAIPLGALALRYRVLRRLSLATAGVLQTVPSLALLALLITIPGFGLSARSAILALFLYAVLPILRNTHTGLSEVDPALLDAARGMGLTPKQILLRVRLPLAIGTILAGVRTATVISVGTATLAAFIGAGGLGEPILTGIYLHDQRLILAGALPAALLALLADLALARLQTLITPRGILLERRQRTAS